MSGPAFYNDSKNDPNASPPQQRQQGRQPAAPLDRTAPSEAAFQASYDTNEQYGSHNGRPIRPNYPASLSGGYDISDRSQPSPQSKYQEYGSTEYGYGYGPPPSDVASSTPTERPYVPSDPRPHEFNQMAPYNSEKAYAEYHSAYGSEASSRPPPSDYDRGVGYDDRRYVPRYDKRRYDSRPPYDDRDRDSSRYSSRPPYQNRPRERVPKSPLSQSSGKDFFRQGDGERGLGAAVLGGAAGALLGHESGRGILGTLGGLAVGAIGANALEKRYESHKEEKQIEARRQYQGSYEDGGYDPYFESRGPSRRDHYSERQESVRDMREHRQRKRESSSEDSWTSDE